MKIAALALVAALAGSASAAPRSKATGDDTTTTEEIKTDELSKYFQQLEAMKLIDAESGTLESLKKELQVAEDLLHDGAFANAAVALYAIVKSPRYSAFTDFI